MSPAARWRAPRPIRRSWRRRSRSRSIGSEQIRDQKPGKFDEILRYTPGVVAGTFGADTRNDWFLIRGFNSNDIGLFLDGLQLFYTSYASWKLQPFNLARVEVLRGPSAVLYGGSSPSGIVNAVSKTPPTGRSAISRPASIFSAMPIWRSISAARSRPRPSGKLFYRVVGQVQNGGTQVDFTPDNNYFIAPSLTWKPDADTTFTVLASASKYETHVQPNFLPLFPGTLADPPFQRIPTQPVRQRSQRRHVQARAGNAGLPVREKPLRRCDLPAERPVRACRRYAFDAVWSRLCQRRPRYGLAGARQLPHPRHRQSGQSRQPA